MRAAVLASFLLIVSNSAIGVCAQNTYSFADFISVTGDSLQARFDSAVTQGRQSNSDTFWVAYEMPAQPNVRVSSQDGIEVSQASRPDRVASFLLVRKSDGEIEKLRIVMFAESIRVHDRRVYWIGNPTSDDSAKLLLRIARTSSSTQVKKDAIFWIGQEVSQLAGGELETLVSNDPEVEVQKQAVFALSLRSNDESIPVLMRIAKEHPNSRVRQQAIFWLGQKRDPRVLDFFEQLLKK